MAPLVFVIAGEARGCSSQATGEERDGRSCVPRWFLSHKLGRLGGPQPQKALGERPSKIEVSQWVLAGGAGVIT